LSEESSFIFLFFSFLSEQLAYIVRSGKNWSHNKSYKTSRSWGGRLRRCENLQRRITQR